MTASDDVRKTRTRGGARRALSTLAILSLSTVCVVTIGANALLTSTKATDDGGAAGGTDVSTGTVVLNLGANGATTNSISIDASGVVPGDTIQRVIDVTNAGTENFASVTLQTTASNTNALTDPTNGLQMKIEECDTSWVKPGGPYVYTCGAADAGTKTNLTNFNSVDVVQAAASVVAGGTQTLNTAGNTAHYRVTLTVPNTYAGSNSSSVSTNINYKFVATQRAGTSK